jgi:hypothetical protein
MRYIDSTSKSHLTFSGSTTEIDRNKPGERDLVRFQLIWPNGEICHLIFADCWYAQMFLNFGVMAEETILSATFIDSSELISQIRSKWSHNVKPIYQVEFEFNSTASKVSIVFSDLNISPGSI